MKVREGFVSNSSSSSFIIAAKNTKELKTKITLEVDFNKYVNETIKTVEELTSYFKEAYDMSGKKLLEDDKYLKMKALIESGMIIFTGDFADDSDDAKEVLLCKEGIDKGTEGVVVIESEGGY